MRTIINNFLTFNRLNQEEAISLLNEYCKHKNNREIRNDELNVLLNQLVQFIDWNFVVSEVALYLNIPIYRLYNKNNMLIKQWIE